MGQFQFSDLPFEHEVLRGYMAPHVTAGGQAPEITLRLTIDPESEQRVIAGSVRCRTRDTPACIGRQAVLSNVLFGFTQTSPREAASADFDADMTFVQEGVTCHLTGTTPLFGILVEVISGSYTCRSTSGSVVETGTFGAIRRRV
jgi:hypothetical protein